MSPEILIPLYFAAKVEINFKTPKLYATFY